MIRFSLARQPGIRFLATALVVAAAVSGCAERDTAEERHPAMEGLEGGWEINITLLGGEQEVRRVFPSQAGTDFDEDGLDDLEEYLQGTDPNDPDTSGDGLLDGPSVVISPLEARAREWLRLGLVHFEKQDGSFEFQGSNAWGVDASGQDMDGDGISNGDEVKGFDVWMLGEPRLMRTVPTRYDTSGDGFSDLDKARRGLAPTSRDTDGDGVQDASDANPYLDFRPRLEVVSLNLSRSETMWVVLQMGNERFQSPAQRLPAGQTPQPGLSSSVLNVTDEGANLRRGAHNLTFVVTAVAEGGSGPYRLDLFSRSTGSENLFAAIHALTGELFWSHDGPGAPVEPWPSTATFGGEDGEITLRLVSVWSEPWQRCIDDGCRHGDGEFPWR